MTDDSMHLADGAIVIRPWCADDVQAVHEACQDPDIQRWCINVPHPYTLADANAFVTGALGLGPFHFAITHDGRVVGSIGMDVGEYNIGEIGYWSAPGDRRRGFVSQALRRLCRHAHEDLGLHRLEIVTDPANQASRGVAERVGFVREGILRAHMLLPDGRRRDSLVLSLLPGELRDWKR